MPYEVTITTEEEKIQKQIQDLKELKEMVENLDKRDREIKVKLIKGKK